ncbi:mammalian cell entry protein, partial [Mycobacterium sp. PSTR-4-N]|nr:mammalian cell entry protein [Mycobacterium sp. PSTR-4-N]
PPDQVVPPYGRTPPAPAAPAPAAPAPAPPPAPGVPAAPSGPLLPAEAVPQPGGPMPQAAGPAMATYDQNGTFVDPAGGTGTFAGGTDKLAPAENWVDLMLAPKQL